MADIARLTQLIEPEATALGFELVRVAMMPSEAGDGGMALQIMAEDPATGQLVIDQCAALSRRVSDVIDAAEEAGEVLIEGAYHLEVSSPGMDRPLTKAADFEKYTGEQISLETEEPDDDGQKRHRGVLTGFSGDIVTMTTDTGEIKVDLANIVKAKLVLTDERVKAALKQEIKE